MMADGFSRRGQLQVSEWSLSREEFDRVSDFWGRPQVDLMATAANRQVVKLVSLIPHPEALGVDAFFTPWPEGGLLYMFPPPSIVAKVL